MTFSKNVRRLKYYVNLVLLLSMLKDSKSFLPFSFKRNSIGVTYFRTISSGLSANNDFFENDILSIRRKDDDIDTAPRLCVMKISDGSTLRAYPLCFREDNLETDLFLDPREECFDTDGKDCGNLEVIKFYGGGFYGQRPVPSLGGGPGYGADADEIWSIDPNILEEIRSDGAQITFLDVGIAHGEKARGGSY